ncbi:hypothetical protein KAR91_82225 [Candidatus Pacearchaeota archaeon]|nr:hypothetical protein [Candidatus Pacearchaeota archaeon]
MSEWEYYEFGKCTAPQLDIKIREFLNLKPFEFIQYLKNRWDEWFLEMYDDPEISNQSIDAVTKEQMIELIMSTDPVFTEGGLLHFLSVNVNFLEWFVPKEVQ